MHLQVDRVPTQGAGFVGDGRIRISVESAAEPAVVVVDAPEAENEQFRERLRAVEDRLASSEAGQSTPRAADD